MLDDCICIPFSKWSCRDGDCIGGGQVLGVEGVRGVDVTIGGGRREVFVVKEWLCISVVMFT